MNMQNLMMQAQKMQKDLLKIQKELEVKTYDGNSQLVDVTVNDKGKILTVNINISEISADDKEILEDMFIVATNNALEKMENDKAEKLGKYSNMFNGLM